MVGLGSDAELNVCDKFHENRTLTFREIAISITKERTNEPANQRTNEPANKQAFLITIASGESKYAEA